MNNLRASIFICLLCTAMNAVGNVHVDLNWKPKQITHDGIATFTAKVEGQSSRAFRGIVTVPYSVEQVSQLLQDQSRIAEWLYHCKFVKPYAAGGDKSTIYLQFARMGPVGQRDVLLDSLSAFDEKTGIFTMDVWNIEHADWPKQKKHVRMKTMQNQWQVKPLANGYSEVEFYTVVHLGGWLPNWMTNIVAVDGPWRILRGLRRQLDRGVYGEKVAAKDQ